MKLDVTALRYLQRDDLRVLTAVEMGMKNHEMVPTTLICSISGLRYGGVDRAIRELHKHKLLHHEQRGYDGYRLTNLGYDYLALAALSKRGSVAKIGNKIGVGKEADVYHAETEEGTVVALKIHRLGRTSFRAVKDKRDYHKHRQSASWLYLSRLAAMRENAFLRALHENEFPVPKPIDSNRHIVVMSLVDGYPLTQVRSLGNPSKVCNELVQVAVRLAEVGLVHCDLNEFNVLINDDEEVTVIDFPQMVSTSHADAPMFFERDVESLYKFFRHRYGLDEEIMIVDYSTVQKAQTLDVELEASGYGNATMKEFEKELDTYRRKQDFAQEEDVSEPDQIEQSSNNSPGESFEPPQEGCRTSSNDSGQDTSSAAKSGATAEASQNPSQGGNVGSESKTERDADDLQQSSQDQNSKEEPEQVEERSESGIAEVEKRMKASTISQKVRKQREKQARKANIRRNATKSEAKRKARSELSQGAFWTDD